MAHRLPIPFHRCWFGPAGLLGLAVLAMVARAQETVYVLPSDLNALMTWGAYPPVAGVVIGDDAHLGGTSRLLQEVRLPVASNRARTATVELALYAREASGYPGSLLWSGIQNVSFPTPLTGEDYARDVLFGPVGLEVPGDLVWAVTFSNITSYDPAVPELAFFGLIWNEADNLASAGSAPGASNDVTRAYRKLPGQPWQETLQPLVGGVLRDATLTVAMRAAPVPEPGMAIVLALAAVGCLRRRRC